MKFLLTGTIECGQDVLRAAHAWALGHKYTYDTDAELIRDYFLTYPSEFNYEDLECEPMEVVPPPPRMDKTHCVGCRDDYYNQGKNSTTGQCWMLDTATLIKRRRVGIDERPPWKREPEVLPSCYKEKGYIFVKPNQER